MRLHLKSETVMEGSTKKSGHARPKTFYSEVIRPTCLLTTGQNALKSGEIMQNPHIELLCDYFDKLRRMYLHSSHLL